jgi:hypothetical protein
MPKKIGGRLYAHKDYAFRQGFDITGFLEVAEDILGDFKWNCVRIKPDGIGGCLEVAFQYSPDFDAANEPQVVQTVAVKHNGDVKVLNHKDTIWHHKWMWVGSDYSGFDYAASKQRSALWKQYVTKTEIPKIGNKPFWDTLRSRWETT